MKKRDAKPIKGEGRKKDSRKDERSFDQPMLHSDGVHVWQPFLTEDGQKLYRLV